MWRIETAGRMAEAEILGLPDDMQARMLWIIELLTKWGPHRVGMPYTRPLRGKLWEIRLKGRAGIARVIFIAATGRRIVLLHAFMKKTQETPGAAIDIALRRAKERGLA